MGKMELLWFVGFATLATSLRLASYSDVMTPQIQSRKANFAEIDGLNNNQVLNSVDLEMQYLQDWKAKTIVPKLPSENKRIAIFVAGLQNRLLLQTKLDNVIVPLIEQGYAVDVFLHLVASGGENGAVWTNNFPGLGARNTVAGAYGNVTNLCGPVRKTLNDIKVNLASCTVLDKSEDVSDHVSRAKKMGLKRLLQYDLKTKTGQNVLRRFYALQNLMNISTSSGEYDYYLVTRDDDHWFSPLNLAAFPQEPANKVFFKNCQGWIGVNDKTFLFGRESAQKVLKNIYSDVLTNNPRLVTWNAEMYWGNYLKMKGAVPKGVDFKLLQTSDAVYQQKKKDSAPVVCVKAMYLCSLSAISRETPQLC